MNPGASASACVLGNLAVDRIDGGPPVAGGVPTFAAAALGEFDGGTIVARAAGADLERWLPASPDPRISVVGVPSRVTSRFSLDYDGEHRAVRVDAIGPSWSAGDVAALDLSERWVHVAPLLRSDVTPAALAALAGAGHEVAYDGQGLVRVPRTGRLQLDAAFPEELLAPLRVLKLADDEAQVLCGGRELDARAARRLGVAEILVTRGSRGCDVYVEGEHQHVPASVPVDGVHTTGAGDCFTVAYVCARAGGADPVSAASQASALVSELLLRRRELQRGAGPARGAAAPDA